MRHAMAPVDSVLLLRSLDTMSDLALIYDRQSRRVYVNKAAQKLGEAVSVFDPYLAEVFKTRDRIVAQQAVIFGGERMSFEIIYTPIPGENGIPQFVIAIARDVSALKAYSMISESTRPSEPEGGSTAERNESVGARSIVKAAVE
jgi:hypothetical protein